jgi:hypothetical protein
MIYTVFSVLSGGLMILVAAVASMSRGFDLKASDRVVAFLFGAGLIVYGIWAASARSGFFVFPVAIFVLPFLFVGYLIFQAWESWGGSSTPEHQASAATAQPRPAVQPRQPPASPRPCPRCGTPAEPGAGWCTQCGNTLARPATAAPAADTAPRRCTRCGTRLGSGVAFCTTCGHPSARAPEPRPAPTTPAGAGAGPPRCHGCGSHVVPADLFCTQCGRSRTP